MSIIDLLGQFAVTGSNAYAGYEEGKRKAETEKQAREERERKALLEQAILDLRQKEFAEKSKPYSPETDPAVLRERYYKQEGLGNYQPEPEYDPATDPAVRREEYFKQRGMGAYRPPRPTQGAAPYNPETDPVIQREQYRRSQGWVGGEGGATDPAAQKDLADIERSIATLNTLTEEPSAAGDMAFLFQFMKLLDPGSVVREGEQKLFRETGSLRNRIQARMQQVRTGQTLTDDMRRDFLNQAQAIAEARRQLILEDSGGSEGSQASSPRGEQKYNLTRIPRPAPPERERR